MAHGTVSLDRVIDKADHTGVLSLSGRNLRQFPMSAQDLSDLQDTLEADISRNRFDKVPREICMFSGLESLNCHHNSIRSVPDYMTYMANLQSLDLSRNYISSLPPEICRLNLVSLNLSHNRLVGVPIDIGSMTSLKKLDLSCNLLPDLPPGLCDLKCLKYLNLHNNELKELPQDLDKLPLDFLDVSTNLIKTIPTSLRHIKSLITLDVSDNPLESPPTNVCIRGRVHIFKYLQSLDERGPDPVVYHPTPADIKRRGRGQRKSRPVSGVSTVSIESSTSSFADEMHRIVDNAFGGLSSTQRKEMHKSDTDLSSRAGGKEDGYHRSHVSSSGVGGGSPGRKRVNHVYGTLPRSSADTRTIVEEEPSSEPVVVKQNSAPAEDNQKVSHYSRSLPGEQKPRSGSWNSRQRRLDDVKTDGREQKAPTPVIGSKTPDFDRKTGPAPSNYSMRTAKSSSDVSNANIQNSSSKEISQERQDKALSPAVSAKLINPESATIKIPSPSPEDCLTPVPTISVTEGKKSAEATNTPIEEIVELDRSPEHPRKAFPNTTAATPTADRKSPEATKTITADEKLISHEGSEITKEMVANTSPEATKKTPQANKKLPVHKSPEATKKPQAHKSPEVTKKVATNKSPEGTKRVTTNMSPETTKKTVAHKSPEATKKTAVNKSPAPVHARKSADIRNSPGPSRKVADSSPGATRKAAGVNKVPPKSASKTSPKSSKKSSPETSAAEVKKHSSPARDSSLSPRGSPTASKKPIRAASKSPVATKRTTVAPNKSPVAARKPPPATAPKNPAKSKPAQKSTSSSSLAKERVPSPPMEKKNKRKSIQDLQLIFHEMAGTEGGETEEQKTPTAEEQPMVLGGGEGGSSVNGEESQQKEQAGTGGEGERKGSVESATSTTSQGEKDDDTLTRRKGVKAKKRNPSTSSTGSTRSRNSSTEDGEELKELMRKRSLPRQPMNFTVRRQEMNMMHGYKKMAAVQKRMEDLLGVAVNEDFLASLEDGANLCLLVNKLHPGTIVQVYTTTDGQPLSVPKKTKNVDAFVKACKHLGVGATLTPGDILSIKDPMKVVKCIEELLGSV